MTEEPILLFRPGFEEDAMAEVARVLRPHLERGRWDAVFLRMHHDGPDSALQSSLKGLSGLAFGKVAMRAGSDYAALPETWAEYRQALGKSMRDNLGYYPRLLTRDGHDWHVRIVRSSQEMPDAARRLIDLHHARAKSDRGPFHCDHIDGAVQEAFLMGLLLDLADRRQGFVAELEVDGEVVASQAFGESGDEMMIYYSGYRETWAKYSPIFVIDAIVFRDALERGVRRLDFLRGMAPWKARWLACPGPKLHRVTLVSLHPAAQLRYALYLAHHTWRRNVSARLPILSRRLATKLTTLRAKAERGRGLLVPLIPHLHRAAFRFTPTLHFATMHHR